MSTKPSQALFALMRELEALPRDPRNDRPITLATLTDAARNAAQSVEQFEWEDYMGEDL